jgi:hypothetical protein
MPVSKQYFFQSKSKQKNKYSSIKNLKQQKPPTFTYFLQYFTVDIDFLLNLQLELKLLLCSDLFYSSQ